MVTKLIPLILQMRKLGSTTQQCVALLPDSQATVNQSLGPTGYSLLLEPQMYGEVEGSQS